MSFKKTVLKKIVELHVYLYRRTGGLVGGKMAGMNVLLLTTTGRKTGLPRTVPLLYDTDGQDFVIIASNSGSLEHPAWYTNLEAHPQVELEIRHEKKKAVARTASPEERPRLWGRMAAKFPNYTEYQKKVARVLPVVLLRPQ